jgi:hypothetical protein
MFVIVRKFKCNKELAEKKKQKDQKGKKNVFKTKKKQTNYHAQLFHHL